MDKDFHLPPGSVGADGKPIEDSDAYEAEHQKRDREYNRINRSMYHIDAASDHVINDRNFLSYC
jgi:hypothetical protein